MIPTTSKLFTAWLSTALPWQTYVDANNEQPNTNKTDPDTYLLKLRSPDNIKNWLYSSTDYLIDYLPPILQTQGKGPKAVADQVKKMGSVLELIPDTHVRDLYFDEIGKNWGAFKKIYKLNKRETIELPKLEKLQSDNKAAYFDFGFWEEEGAYWTFAKESKYRICTFTIKILFFVRNDAQPKYVCLFTNMFGRHKVASVTTDDFTSVGNFRKVIGRLHGFIFEGSDYHLNKIKIKLFFGVREAEEPNYLGYNKHGNFYTWANGLWQINTSTFNPTDKYGIVEMKEAIKSIDDFKALPQESHVLMNDELIVLESSEKFLETNTEQTIQAYITSGKAFSLTFYFLPYSGKLRLSEQDDSDTENTRKFKYTIPQQPATNNLVSTWGEKMIKVYGTNGMIGIGYYTMSLFRDIIYKANNNYIPILGAFGMRQSGKSTFARSLSRMFGDGSEDGINLNSGGSTPTGILRSMAAVQNAMLWLNEYTNALPDVKIEMLKGLADGSGKVTGMKTATYETINYAPRSTAIYCGQDYPTRNPALLSRTVLLEFDAKNRNQIDKEDLIAWELTGFGSQVTCQLMSLRDQVKALYSKVEPLVTKMLRTKTKDKFNVDVDDRLLLNVSSILSVMLIACNPQPQVDEDCEDRISALIAAPITTYQMQFGFSLTELQEALVASLKMQLDIQHTSDDVEQYFQVVMTLVERKQVFEDTHYKLTKTVDGLRLYLRVQQIHGLYRQQAEQADYVAMDIGTLRSYLPKHRSFKKYHEKNVRFANEKNATSAFEFDYDYLLQCGIELRTGHDTEKMMSEI